MLNGFWLDGICSLDVGIRLQSGITFGQPTPRVTSTTISGRSGDLTEWDGSYGNVSAAAKCFALTDTDVSDTLPTIAAFLRGTTFSYRRLETEEEPNVYRMARVVNFPETDIRANHLAPFTISLDCKPQKYLKDGENAVEVKSGDSLYNPTVFPSVTVAGVTANSRIAVSDRTRVTDAVRMVAALEPGAGVVKFYANSALTSAAVFVLEVSQ